MVEYEEILDEAVYSDRDALASYFKGWLPCLTTFPDEDTQQLFLNDVIEESWKLFADETNQCSIPYVKLEMILEKPKF